MKRIFIMILALAVAAGAGYASFAVSSQRELARSVVRLRVVAAGNSDRDQQIKLLVRDCVLSVLEEKAFSSREEALDFLAGSEQMLEEKVNCLLEKEETGYIARIELGNVLYPESRYNSFALPAGRYLACTVTLGPGRGENWWCVLFPPLCYGMEPTEEMLETGSILLEGQEEPEIVFRFRILEWIKAIKNKWEG